MIARFIFAETICEYEHSAPRFVTKDIELPEGFVPTKSMGYSKMFPSDEKHPYGRYETVYDKMDLKGVELIDDGKEGDAER